MKSKTTLTLIASLAVSGLMNMALAQNPADGGGDATAPAATTSSSSLPALTLPAAGTKLSRGDSKFLEFASEVGAAEVADGQLATDKAQSDAVKQLAQKLVADHTAVNDQIQQLASAYGAKVASEPNRAGKREHDQLAKKSGTDFDADYLKAEVDDHQKAIDLYQKESTGGNDPALKQFASNVLPILQQRLKDAQMAATAAPAAPPAAPAIPAMPTSPAGPAAPNTPTAPAGPAVPDTPTAPAGPAAPDTPSAPAAPAAPAAGAAAP